MLDAVADMVAQSAAGCLKKVRIVIFQQATMKDFHSRMEKKAASDMPTASYLGKIKGKELNNKLKQGSATYGPLSEIGIRIIFWQSKWSKWRGEVG